MSSSFQGDDSVSRGQHKQADFTDGTVAQALAEAICTVCQLETSSISMNVDLFQLGLDSLAAMRLLQLLRHNDLTASAAQHLDVAKVLRAGSCADLVRLLSTLGGTVADRSSENERSREHRDQEWTTQSGMLTSFLTRAASSGSKRPYISHMVYHMATESEASKFYNALRQVTQRHDIYRTVFVPVDDKLAPFAQCLLSPGSDEGNVSKHFSKTTLGALETGKAWWL
ncbi:hypothetical protein [Sporisorium scitamineum]|uniref:Carrier domain-containing protein n=1 Tax=Sporisorium scitamineum TaxID=49012 RepID=A0A0F7RUB2_9BASI|nr:hypothetical protein [Sporisorium scitamineum]